MGKIAYTFAALLLAVSQAGCGGARTHGRARAPEGEPDQKQTEVGDRAKLEAHRAQLIARGDDAFEQRLEEPRLREAIDTWENAVADAPGDFETHIKLARAYYFLADAHLSADKSHTEEMLDTYEKSMDSAQRALVALSPEFAERVRNGEDLGVALAALDVRAVGALYWRATALVKWAVSKGFATVLTYEQDALTLMQRCVELDETYFYGAPHRYLGAYFARAPEASDMEKSTEHFERSLAIAPDYIGTHRLYAQLNAVKAGNRALFEEQLKLAMDADPKALTGAIPENIVEQKRAKALLAQESELFSKETAPKDNSDEPTKALTLPSAPSTEH